MSRFARQSVDLTSAVLSKGTVRPRPRGRALQFERLETRTLLSATSGSAGGESETGQILRGVMESGLQFEAQTQLMTSDVAGSHPTSPGVPAGFDLDNDGQYDLQLDTDGVAQLTIQRDDGTFRCSGALISDRHLLTAAHCLTDVSGQLTAYRVGVTWDVVGSTLGLIATTFHVHPGYNGDFVHTGNDIAIIELSQEADDEIPRYSVYEHRGTEFGRPIVEVGYGQSGFGGTGEDGGRYPFGTKRAVLNRWESDAALWGAANGQNQLGSDFDSGQAIRDGYGTLYGIHDLGYGIHEGSTARGDSGGPAFLYDTLDRRWEIAGVTSYGVRLSREAEPSSPDLDDRVNFTWGEFAAHTRVSSYLDFLGTYAAQPQSLESSIGESGRVTVAQSNARQWHWVAFGRDYVQPTVVVGPLSYQGAQPATVRVRNVRPSGFEFQIDEWDYLDGRHIAETLGYLVVEAGTHDLGDGRQLTAGTTSANHLWKDVNLAGFSEPPVVLAQAATRNGPSAVTARLQNVTESGFQVRMQEQERNAPKHALETVHYVAISTGTNRNGGSEWEAARVPNQLNHRLRQLDFEQPFSQPPVLLGAVQSQRGRDPVTLRYTSLSDKATAVFLEEERSKNAETWHTDEVVGYLALAPGPIERAVPLSTPLVQATPTPDLQATIPLWGSQTQGLQAPRARFAPHPTADSVADQLWCRAVVSRDSGSRSASAPPSEFPSFEPLDIATALDVVTAGMFGLSRSGGN